MFRFGKKNQTRKSVAFCNLKDPQQIQGIIDKTKGLLKTQHKMSDEDIEMLAKSVEILSTTTGDDYQQRKLNEIYGIPALNNYNGNNVPAPLSPNAEEFATRRMRSDSLPNQGTSLAQEMGIQGELINERTGQGRRASASFGGRRKTRIARRKSRKSNRKASRKANRKSRKN